MQMHQTNNPDSTHAKAGGEAQKDRLFILESGQQLYDAGVPAWMRRTAGSVQRQFTAKPKKPFDSAPFSVQALQQSDLAVDIGQLACP